MGSILYYPNSIFKTSLIRYLNIFNSDKISLTLTLNLTLTGWLDILEPQKDAELKRLWVRNCGRGNSLGKKLSLVNYNWFSILMDFLLWILHWKCAVILLRILMGNLNSTQLFSLRWQILVLACFLIGRFTGFNMSGILAFTCSILQAMMAIAKEQYGKN